MESPEERDRRREDEMEPRGPDPRVAAEMILETPLDVKLTPRQIGRLIGLVTQQRDHWDEANELGEADACEFILEQLTRAVAQIGARP